jgi:glycosyltransferase involved in cell wall biosynthesis
MSDAYKYLIFTQSEMKSEPNKPRIAFVPFEEPTNNYVARMQQLLSNFAFIEPIKPKGAIIRLLKGNLKPYDIVWVNWVENTILDYDGRLNLINVLRLFLKTSFLVLVAKKSVFVRHNHYPHSTKSKDAAFVTTIINVYELFFSVVVTHSGSEVNKNKSYCPHPLYTVVENINLTHKHSSSLPPEYFIVFGRIVPYKKIESLIKNFPSTKALVVAGSAPDKSYKDYLESLKIDNFYFLPGYLTESEAQALVTNAKAVVISHSDKEMVVSGTFFYAMSLGKPVFAVQTDFLNWIKPRISPKLLFLADDIDSLCGLIEKTSVETNSSETYQSIQDEFGDEAVIAALSKILNKK